MGISDSADTSSTIRQSSPAAGGTIGGHEPQDGKIQNQGFYYRDNEELITELSLLIATEKGDILCSQFGPGRVMHGGGTITLDDKS